MTPKSAVVLVCLALGAAGCRSAGAARVTGAAPAQEVAAAAPIQQTAYDGSEPLEQPISLASSDDQDGADEAAVVRPLPAPVTSGDAEETVGDTGDAEVVPPPTLRAPTVPELANSVRLHFPVIQEAIAARTVASGETLSAWGAFDHKLEAFSESQPLDFYENYRHEIGVKRDTYWGGQTFAGYSLGRGSFEPWFLEREKNKGGEFKTGFVAPLLRDRFIDANRAELWRAQLEQGRVEPEIRAIVILSVLDATAAYWEWVAAGANLDIAEGVLRLGLNRIGFLEKQIENGFIKPIDRVDNERIIVSRQAKVIDARRKLEQTAIKLSLFFRDDTGSPIILSPETPNTGFPETYDPETWDLEADVAFALATRPELEELQVVRRQLGVALNQARNETQPEVDGGVLIAQDVGEPTSSKRDKSEFELEASLMVSVPLERRKAFGKIRQLRGKLAQVRAKTRFASDKIAAETRAAHAALVAAAQRVEQTTEGVALARRMQEAEKRLYELGDSTLFNLNLREQQAAEAATAQIVAQLDYHLALAAYAAALGLDSSEDLAASPEQEADAVDQL